MYSRIVISVLGVSVLSSCNPQQMKEIEAELVTVEEHAVADVQKNVDSMILQSEGIPAACQDARCDASLK